MEPGHSVLVWVTSEETKKEKTCEDGVPEFHLAHIRAWFSHKAKVFLLDDLLNPLESHLFLLPEELMLPIEDSVANRQFPI